LSSLRAVHLHLGNDAVLRRALHAREQRLGQRGLRLERPQFSFLDRDIQRHQPDFRYSTA
jgi:hypothetical protein